MTLIILYRNFYPNIFYIVIILLWLEFKFWLYFLDTYNVARKAIKRFDDTDQPLDSEVTDKEKGRGKRRIMQKRHFDDYSDNDDVIPINQAKKKNIYCI